MKMRVIHEFLMYLTEALKLDISDALGKNVRQKIDELESLSLQEAEAICALDMTSHKRDIDNLIEQVGEIVRTKSSFL